MAEVSKENIISHDSFSTTREFPRSPASISPVSSRRQSLRNASDKSSEPQTPSSPPMRLTRKRAASLDTDSANHPRIEDLELNSAKPPIAPNPAREQVCLCQPDPKIPRPRNAFILYRQHYQAQVVAQHPGLANPEISKIIGEQWRDQPQDIKNEWKRLAEEEKQRHQRQYPDYRYQPRRAGKPNGGRPVSSSTVEDPIRCPKCNGRYISTPGTPLTPFTPSYQPHNGPGNGRLLASFEGPPTPAQDQHYSMSTQRSNAPLQHQVPRHRSQFSGPVITPMHLGPLREADEVDLSSPELKRRRVNFNPDSNGPSSNRPGYATQPQYGPPHFQQRMPQSGPRHGGWSTPMPMTMSLPSPGQLMGNAHHQGGMDPPPRPSPGMAYSPHPMQQQQHHHPQQQQQSRAPFDESLRLPPLQTSMVVPSNAPAVRPVDSQVRSVEAMVMTIPFLNKIKVLSKISPPLAPPGHGSPVHEIRGAVIAVEGADAEKVAEVGKYLTEYLNKEEDVSLQIWEEEASEKGTTLEGGDVVMNNGDDASTTPTQHESFVKYLSTIQSWHKKGLEMTKFITTPPPPSGNGPAPTNTSSASGAAEPSAGPAATKSRTPIALLPTGFSLSTSDHFASKIPINDAYAPVDHWQWTATLFRGIVGPDLTIYVKSPGQDEDIRAGGAGAGGVEVRSDCAAILVGGTEEKTLRRVGFEVVEFVRGLGGVGSEGRY